MKILDVASSTPRRAAVLHRLVDLLEGVAVTRVISSPSLRCRQTLEPLAARRGLPLETDARLAEGCEVPAALGLLESLGEESAVLCSHEDIIPGLIERLCAEREELRGELPCEKGSVWVLEGSCTALESASYLPPPAKRRRRDASRGVETGRDIDGPGPRFEPEKLRVAVLDLARALGDPACRRSPASHRQIPPRRSGSSSSG